ncbi:MAG: hypothetical protein J5J00_05400 [Deltaproteobacteria bacterium]|nr:hypothetical protein [Deltaproteobacteria bacterium]
MQSDIGFIQDEAKEPAGNAQAALADPIKIKDSLASRIACLPQLLRSGGACLLILAAAIAMLQSWEGMSHQLKYFSFLALTVLLAACGVISGLRLKESKGARTFLAIAAAIVPFHFCQLGGFIYSQFVDPQSLSLPEYALWVAESPEAAAITAAAGIICLAPIVILAFAALIPGLAGPAAALYLLLNALLLIPLRDPLLVSPIIAVMGIGALVGDIKLFRSSSSARTNEGLLVRLMLASPFLLIVTRSLMLYNPTEWLIATVLACLAALIFIAAPRYLPRNASQVQASSVIPAALSWNLAANEIVRLFHPYLSDSEIILHGLPFAMLLLVMSRACVGTGRAYRSASAIIALVSIMLQLSFHPGFWTAFTAMVTGITVLIYCYLSRNAFLAWCAGITALSGLMYDVYYAFRLADFSPWIGMSLVGIALILVSSFIERRGPSWFAAKQ